MTNKPRHDVFETISSDGFSYGDYFNGEQNIIKPRLEALGFTNIRFFSIEADSFGPLIRGIDTDTEWFYYG